MQNGGHFDRSVSGVFPILVRPRGIPLPGITEGAVQGWGLLSQSPPFRYFPNFSALWIHTLAIEYHVYIWQVSPQLSCGDPCEIWMWFKYANRYFGEIENFAYGEINERGFSNPNPIMSAFFECWLFNRPGLQSIPEIRVRKEPVDPYGGSLLPIGTVWSACGIIDNDKWKHFWQFLVNTVLTRLNIFLHISC